MSYLPEVRNKSVYYCDPNGSDDNIGTQANPFRTIGYANDVAISMLNPVVDWDEAVVIHVAPGKYTEHIVNSHRRVFIVGASELDFEHWNKPTIIYNTGADEDHYPINPKEYLNLADLQVETDQDGIYGELINRGTFSLCKFNNGYFIENSAEEWVSSYFNNCLFYGKAFKLEGVINSGRFIALRNCDMSGTDALFATTGTGDKILKLEGGKASCNLAINGIWSLDAYSYESYGSGKTTFNTDGFVSIFSSTVSNGIHFYSDTPETKKVVNCIFKDTPVGEGDITADVAVEFIEYSGNHQHNGIDGEIITVSKIKNVGGGQNKYRDIYEALKGSKLTDTIINLEGDIVVTEPLVVNPNIEVQIDGNKKWKLTTTHATTLLELGLNQKLSFVNMKQIIGGKKAILNGGGSSLSFVSCGRYTEPNYVNIEINDGDVSSFVYVVKTTLIGTGAQPISVNDRDVWLIIDRSFIRGSFGEPAIEWSVDADSRFRCKYSTFIHGSGGTNSPLRNTDSGDITLSMYNCALNAAFPTADFTNNIGNSNNTIDPQIDY